jgi:alpha-tubulin suppressor-like RCC1 family protein
LWTLPVDSLEYRTERVVALPAGLFTAVSGGGEHSCGLRRDGTVACWGHNNYGQAGPPLGRFVVVASGGWHSCALRDDGTVECWGLSKVGAPGEGARSENSGGACFIRGPDTTYCWRSAGYEPDGAFSAISAGAIHTCGLRLDGTIDCWGHGAAGRIDAPGRGRPVIPLPPSPDQLEGDSLEETPRSLRWTPAAYAPILCEPFPLTGASSVGAFFCSVQGDVGQADPPEGTYTAVAAGGWHTCALGSDSTLTCWGDNSFGQADPPEGTYTAVDAGWAHTCSLRADGAITCWGDNTHEQTSPPPGDYTDLAAGGTHTCALRADRTIVCWGTRGHPQPPDGVRWQ